MKIASIGSTGFVGKAVVSELLERNHQVTVLVRDPTKFTSRPGVTAIFADAYDVESIAAAVQGHDAVVSAFNPGWNDAQLYDNFIRGSIAIERGVEAGGVERLLVVGGAGSLFVAPGVQLVDTPEFIGQVPANVIPGARAARDALTTLRTNTSLDWTMVSPPAFLEPGERTGSYRVGGDDLLMAGDKPASISVADFAIAIADELERPQHVRARFTVAART